MGSGLGKLGVLPVRVYISSFIHLDVLSAAQSSWWRRGVIPGRAARCSGVKSIARAEQNRTEQNRHNKQPSLGWAKVHPFVFLYSYGL